MSHALNPFAERSITIVAAMFRDGHTADRVVHRLRRHSDIGLVNVVTPRDRGAALKLEPEPDGIAQTFLRALGMLGLAGLLAGLVAAAVLILLGWPPAISSPALTAVALGGLGSYFGLIAGGVLALRPDHDWLIQQVADASRCHRWTVVARPWDRRGVERACRLLRATGARVIRTF